jgi:hypothetical protein
MNFSMSKIVGNSNNIGVYQHLLDELFHVNTRPNGKYNTFSEDPCPSLLAKMPDAWNLLAGQELSVRLFFSLHESEGPPSFMSTSSVIISHVFLLCDTLPFLTLGTHFFAV